MSFDNVKREYHMDFANVTDSGDEFPIFGNFHESQPPMTSFSSHDSSPEYNHAQFVGQMVLDVIEGFLLIICESGFIKYASPNVEKYTSYTADQLIGNSVYRILHQEDRRLLRPLVDAVSGQAPVQPGPTGMTLRLLPSSASPATPLLTLEATLKLQPLPDQMSTCAGLRQRCLVCLLKPQPRPLSPHLPPQPAAAVVVKAVPPIQTLPSPTQPAPISLPTAVGGHNGEPLHSLADYISCRHLCAAESTVVQAGCSPALAAKGCVQPQFFLGRNWSELVLTADNSVWLNHVEDVVSGKEDSASAIYRCQVASEISSGGRRFAFVKSRSRLCPRQAGQFASTHCIIRFCDADEDLQGSSPSATLLRRTGRHPSQPQSQPQPPPQLPPPTSTDGRPQLGERECQELLSLGALYKACARQDPARAAVLRDRMLALWAGPQTPQPQAFQPPASQQQQQQQQQQLRLQLQKPTPAAPTSRPSSVAARQQPASLLMELLNGPSPHSCAVRLTAAGNLQELLSAKDSQSRTPPAAADQPVVSSTTATPTTPLGRKRQPSWPEGGGDPDSSTEPPPPLSLAIAIKRRPELHSQTPGTQLLAALLSEPAAMVAPNVNNASAEIVGIKQAAAAAGNLPADGEAEVLDSILRSLDHWQFMASSQTQLQLPTIPQQQQPPPPQPPPPLPPLPPHFLPPRPGPIIISPIPTPLQPQLQQQTGQSPLVLVGSGGGVSGGGSAELPEDVVLDIILDMEDRHRRLLSDVPDSTTSSGGGGVSVGSVSAPLAPPTSRPAGGLLEKLLST